MKVEPKPAVFSSMLFKYYVHIKLWIKIQKHFQIINFYSFSTQEDSAVFDYSIVDLIQVLSF